MVQRVFGRRRAHAPPQALRSASESAPAPTAEHEVAPEHLALLAEIHEQIIESIDLSQIDRTERAILATEISNFIDTLTLPALRELSPSARRTLVYSLVNDLKGLGPIEPLLEDQTISDILVNCADDAYVERRGRLEPIRLPFRDEGHLLHIAQRIAAGIGRRIDEASPMVDARLADGSRVNIIIPPLALRGTTISIRRFVLKESDLTGMAQRQVLSSAMAEFLAVGVRARLNILISGGTGAGKTTFMNALSREIPHTERLITIEDAAELQLQQPHVVSLETRTANVEGAGEISMRALLINTLRMRPDRIIIGEIRGPEAYEMLQAMNTGHPGSMCTMHANTPRDALTRIENMLMSASGGDIPLLMLRRQIASSLDLIIQLERQSNGHRSVTSITNVAGIENDVITTEELWRYAGTGTLAHRFESNPQLPSSRCKTQLKQHLSDDALIALLHRDLPEGESARFG